MYATQLNSYAKATMQRNTDAQFQLGIVLYVSDPDLAHGAKIVAT